MPQEPPEEGRACGRPEAGLHLPTKTSVSAWQSRGPAERFPPLTLLRTNGCPAPRGEEGVGGCRSAHLKLLLCGGGGGGDEVRRSAEGRRDCCRSPPLAWAVTGVCRRGRQLFSSSTSAFSSSSLLPPSSCPCGSRCPEAARWRPPEDEPGQLRRLRRGAGRGAGGQGWCCGARARSSPLLAASRLLKRARQMFMPRRDVVYPGPSAGAAKRASPTRSSL